jgi:hypothetical protein
MEKMFVGIILMAIGFLFLIGNRNIAKRAAAFYQKFYTEENLKIMFKVLGAFLVAGGFLLIFTK